jgi:hypothetical protein
VTHKEIKMSDTNTELSYQAQIVMDVEAMPDRLKFPDKSNRGKFSVQVNVSVPRREFNADWLASRLMKDYKVPVSITKQLIEEAKRPGTTQVRRLTVAEKGA